MMCLWKNELEKPVTSYSNSGGQGARGSIITVTSPAYTGSGAVQHLVDGSTATGDATSARFYIGGAPSNILFHFTDGTPRYIDEITMYTSGSEASNWKWQASADGSTFVDITPTFAWNNTTQVVGTTLPDYSGYLYYRLLRLTSNANDPWITEFKFKIAAGVT